MPDITVVMAEALKDVLIDTENGEDITMDTYYKVKQALDMYNEYFIEQTIHGAEEECMEGC